MSKRYWVGYSSLALIILMTAFAGGYWLVSDYRKIHAYQRNEAASYKSDSADKELNDPCTGSGIVDGLNCVIREAKANREDKRSEYDLQAQQDMSAWALWMVLISGSSILVTAVGIVFVKMTLDEARRTTRAALRNNVHSRTAADQARRANEIAQESAIEGDRAWMQISITSPDVRVIDDNILIDCFIYGENIGTKPALRARVIIDCFNAIGDKPTEARDRLVGMIKTIGLPNGVTFPKQRTGGIGASFIIPLSELVGYYPRVNVCVAYHITGSDRERFTFDGFDIQAVLNGKPVPIGFDKVKKIGGMPMHVSRTFFGTAT